MNAGLKAAPLARARCLGPAIAATADEIERLQFIPPSLLDELHASRLFRMFLPHAVDGDEVEPWVYFSAIEEISRHDGSVGWNLFVANSAALIAPYLEGETLHAIFADPCAVVAWGPPNACKALAVPGGYRITGAWGFASGCRQASWMGIHANVVEAEGSLRLNDAGRPIIRTLLFPAAHAAHVENWNTIGLRGTASEGYRVDDLFVPEAFSATREDPALRRLSGRLYAFPMQELYAVGVAGVASGIARAMLEVFCRLAVQKSPRGMERLAGSAVVQARVARMEARLGAARAYLVETLRDIWAGADECGTIVVRESARLRLACTHAIQEAIAVAHVAYRTAGVDAIFLGMPLERRFRDIYTLSQQIQAREAHFESVGRILLNVEAEAPF